MTLVPPASRNISSSGPLDPALRERRLGQKGAVLWLTGLPAAGKSTVARGVERTLVERGKNAFVLDGDNVRSGLNSDLGFSPQDRRENIRRIGEMAKLFAESNVLAITACISPYRADRDLARGLAPAGSFFEIFCDTPLATCEERDPKGLYRKARAGEISEFTGISAPYEAPLNPELVLNTGSETVGESVERVLYLLISKGILVFGS